MKEDFEDERAQLEIQSLKDGIERERVEFETNKEHRIIDILSCKQELVRRNIEACMNVLRGGGMATSNGGMTVGSGAKTLAEQKLKEFLAKLEVA